MSLALPDGAQWTETPSGVPLLQLSSNLVQTSLSLLGGQLLTFRQPHTHPWLYLSPQAFYHPGKAIRGGVPICWPWFGPHASEATAPQHGVARQSLWTLDKVHRENDTFHVVLSGPRYEGLSLTARYTLGESLMMALETRNHSDQPHTLGNALHTYLAVSDIEQIRLRGLENASSHDKLANQRQPLPDTPLTIHGEFDSIAYSTQAVTLEDTGWRRRLHIASQGSGSCVLWNPWQDKAARMADLPDDAWRRFVCVETANAGDDCRILLPGEHHVLVTHIHQLPQV